MKKVFVFAGLAAFAAAGAAQVQYLGGDSTLTTPYWFSDYFGSNVVINGVPGPAPTVTGLGVVDIQDSQFPNGNHFANRHQAALSVGGVPIQLNPGATDFRFECDVNIHVSGGAKAEAGIWFGTAPSYPSSAGADIGQMDVIPSNPEIAAFGGTLPFFSNHQAQYSYLPTAAYDTLFHISMNYYAAANVIVYGVNGLYTQALGISHNGNPGFAPGSLIGVFEQGPDAVLPPGNAAALDVTFTNLQFTVPGPSSLSLIGLGGLLAARRRR